MSPESGSNRISNIIQSKRENPQEKYSYFKITRSEDREISFLIKFKDGKQKIIQYHDLVSPYDFDGNGLIELTTPTLSIKIIGKNLEKIFNYIRRFRLDWIKEPDSSLIEVKDGEPEIERIEITNIS